MKANPTISRGGSSAPPFAPGRSTLGLVAAALLGIFVVQGVIAARRDSVTIDEFVSLPIGLHALRTGDLRQDPINPHVTRMLAALPLLLTRPVFAPEPATAVWGFGYHFMDANASRYHGLYFWPRMVIVLLGAATAAIAALWARRLYGPREALVVLFLFAFSPSLLAHTHLVTHDMAGTFGFVAALYAAWLFLDRPSPRSAALLGVVLGVVNLLKLSAFVLTAIVVVLCMVRALRERRSGPSPARWVGLLAMAAIVALVVLNAGYGFDGTLAPLGAANLAAGGKLATLAAAAPWLRLPLPTPFLSGVDMVFEVGKGHEPSYFLLGELSADGWWYYHLAAFAAKCPLPLLGASLLALGAWLAGRSRGLRDYCLFVPVVMVFAANSALNSLYIGERHVLPVYPLLFIATAPWVVSALDMRSRSASRAGRAAALAAAAALVWYAGATLAVAPRYLQFFNEAAGGTGGGHRVLIDSNIDWGQDLVRLREYMSARHIDSVALAYFGRVDPGIYGVRYTPLERGLSKGVAVVSASFLMGRPYFWILGGRMRWVPARSYTWLQDLEPVDRVGSMFVFRLP
ncbi:MAG: glycosyltransferase family 39 protein [Deltaproteobacteria bacterium]|nr:glycosyltransferase family 39 protein [Deltaproteobacteria bacterium]